MNFFQDDSGHWSFMRLAIGFVLLVGGFGFVWSIMHGYSQGVITAGALIAISNIGKALQKKYEQ